MNCFSAPRRTAPPPPSSPRGLSQNASKALLTLPMSRRVFGLAQRPALRRPGSAESPPPCRSALSLRVHADSRKPGSGARQVEVSQLRVSFSVSNQTCAFSLLSSLPRVSGSLVTLNPCARPTPSKFRCLAAAAKSLQSCPTLCDPIDGSPPGSSVPGILQARTLEWVDISFSRRLGERQRGAAILL